MRHLLSSLLIVVIATLIGHARPALAQSTKPRVRKELITEKLSKVRVELFPGRATLVTLKHAIIETKPGQERWKVQVDVRQTFDTIELFAPRGTSPSKIEGSLLVATMGGYVLMLEVHAAQSLEQADDVINVEPAELISLCAARDDQETKELIAHAVAERDAEHRKEIEAKEAESDEKEAEHARELADLGKLRDRDLLGQVSERLQEEPLIPVPCKDEGASICEVRLMLMGENGLLRFTFSNRSGSDAPVADARVYNESTGEDLATSTHIAVESEREGAAPDSGPLGVIPRGARAIVSVKLRAPERLSPSFRIVLNGAVHPLPVMQPVHLMDRMQLEAEERERQRQREREAKRVQLQVMGSFGALFVPEVDGPDDTDATSLMGASVRVIKGMTPMTAIDVEVSGIASGETSAMESAKLGRVVVGGRIRSGETSIWHLRMGVGFQAIRTTTAASTQTEGSGVVTIGGGMDWRFGDSFTAGVSAGGSLRGFERIQTIEAGIHFGLVLAP